MNELKKETTDVRPRWSLGNINYALVIALFALIFGIWQWYDYRQRLKITEHKLAERLAVFDTRNKEIQAVAKDANDSVQTATARLALLDNKLTQSQDQQIALEALYQELARSRDEWTLAEIEQILLIANQQLQLSGNVKAALIAMQTADNHLQRLNLPQLLTLRRAIAKDIQRLQALPSMDIEGLSARLDGLIELADDLPLLIESAAEVEPRTPPFKKPEGYWARFTHDIWSELKQMVRLQNTERAQIPLLSPEQSYFLRENLKLRLLSARLSLLQRNEAIYKRDIDAAYYWVNKYFNVKAVATQNTLTSLKQLSAAYFHIALPDINTSLNAVRDYKLAKESRS